MNIHSRHQENQNSPFTMLSRQPDIWLARAIALRLARVLRAVKDQHFSSDSFGGDEIWVLGHVSRAVDLSFMVDFLDDLYPRAGWQRVSSELATLIVVVGAFKLIGARGGVVAFGDLDCGDLKVVLRLSGCVRSKEKSVGCVGLRGIPAKA
jgi:hypothetical protein